MTALSQPTKHSDRKLPQLQSIKWGVSLMPDEQMYLVNVSVSDMRRAVCLLVSWIRFIDQTGAFNIEL